MSAGIQRTSLSVRRQRISRRRFLGCGVDLDGVGEWGQFLRARARYRLAGHKENPLSSLRVLLYTRLPTISGSRSTRRVKLMGLGVWRAALCGGDPGQLIDRSSGSFRRIDSSIRRRLTQDHVNSTRCSANARAPRSSFLTSFHRNSPLDPEGSGKMCCMTRRARRHGRRAPPVTCGQRLRSLVANG